MAHLPNLEVPKYEALLELSERYPSMDPLATTTFLYLLITSDEVFRGASKVFIQYQISKGKFMLMMRLFDKKDGSTRKLSPAELADGMDVTRATVTGLLDGLERDGIVLRERDENDKRMIVVSLTESGIALMEEILPVHFANLQNLMMALNNEEMNQLNHLLAKLCDHVGKVYPNTQNMSCGCDFTETTAS